MPRAAPPHGRRAQVTNGAQVTNQTSSNPRLIRALQEGHGVISVMTAPKIQYDESEEVSPLSCHCTGTLLIVFLALYMWSRISAE